jgi:hypothetical protein
LDGFVKKIIGIFSDECGCQLQDGGCPCNTCFFSKMEEHGIDDVTAHFIWWGLLGLREDGNNKQDISHKIELLKKMQYELEKAKIVDEMNSL